MVCLAPQNRESQITRMQADCFRLVEGSLPAESLLL